MLYRLKGNPVEFRSGPAAVILIPEKIRDKRLCRYYATVLYRMGRLARVGKARRPACQQLFNVPCSTFDVAAAYFEPGTENFELLGLSAEEGEDEENQGAILKAFLRLGDFLFLRGNFHSN